MSASVDKHDRRHQQQGKSLARSQFLNDLDLTQLQTNARFEWLYFYFVLMCPSLDGLDYKAPAEQQGKSVVADFSIICKKNSRFEFTKYISSKHICLFWMIVLCA